MIDYHAHSKYSYCCDPTIDAATYAAAVVSNPDLSAVYITDHSYHIYFPRDVLAGGSIADRPELFDRYREFGNERMKKYLAEIDPFRGKGVHPGIETEMMFDGRLTLDESFYDSLDIVIGSLHPLPIYQSLGYTDQQIFDAWLRHLKGLLEKPIDVLGHPFRWYASVLGKIPESLVSEVVAMAREAGVAVEINSHNLCHEIRKSHELILAKAIETDTPVVFGTDAHSRHDIGDFSYHYALLERLGLSIEEIPFWGGRLEREYAGQ